MSDETPERRSYATTGFLTFLLSWGASLAAMLTNTDGVVRKWAAIGMVALPALYLLCSTLIKRAKLRQARATSPALPLLGLAKSLSAVPPPRDPGSPK